MAKGNFVVYAGEDWSALYIDGKLKMEGDGYLIDEYIRSHFGVETVDSDDFLLGGRHAADTMDEITAYREHSQAQLAAAAKLREQAAQLEAQAKALENKPRA